MGKYVLRTIFHVVIVLTLVLRCYTVPVRVLRQAQDIQLTQEDIDPDDYNADNSDHPIVDDDTSQLSPHDDTRSDNLQGNIDYAEHLDGNNTLNHEHAEISSDGGNGGALHDLELKHDQGQGPGIDLDRHLDENHPGGESYVSGNVDVQGQSHLPSHGHSDHGSTVSQGYVQMPGSTQGTTRSGSLVINAVGRAVTNVNVSTSKEQQHHHGFLMGESLNSSTTEERRPNHGFLIGDTVETVQTVGNEGSGINANVLTSTSSATVHTAIATTTPEPFMTVRMSNISSHEWTEGVTQEHAYNNDIIIDRTDQNSGGRAGFNPETVDKSEQSHDHVTTEVPFVGEGHVATLPGEQHVDGQGPENEEQFSGHEEPEGRENGIDVPIDKGEQTNNVPTEEHNEPGPTRHTNNNVVTGTTTENIPITEPVLTTPKLIILPTPSHLEPEERNTTAANQEPRYSMTTQSSVYEHTEPDNEGQGHPGVPAGINENSGSRENNTEEKIFITDEGHTEFITELPEIPRENEKPNKNLPKYSEVKFSTTRLLLYSSLSESKSLSSQTRSVTSEEYVHKTSITNQLLSSFGETGVTRTNIASQTVKPEVMQSSASNQVFNNLEITSSKSTIPYPQSEIQSSPNVSPSSPIPDDLLLTSHSFATFKHSTLSESSIPSFADISTNQLQETSTMYQQPGIVSSRDIETANTESPKLTFSPTLSSNGFSTRNVDENTSENKEGSLSPTTVSATQIVSTQSVEQFSQSSKTIFSTEVYNMGKSETHLTATPVLTESTYSSTELLGLKSSTGLEPMHSTQEPVSQSSVSIATQTPPSSVNFPLLTSNPTTKKKEDHSSTTTMTTQKKPNTDKEPDKPYIQSSHAVPTSTSSTGSSVGTITTSQTVATTLPSTLHTTTTQKYEISTPPSVYIEIKLRMDWSQFCVSRSEFISDIKDIILSEKGYDVTEEQFILSTEYCRIANNILLDEDHIITINMYIVGVDGKLDILLTTVTSSVILKGFQQSNYLKDKIVSVHTINRKQPETLPESKSERNREQPSVTMVIVLASMGGVCCVALVILQLLIHRRVKAKRKQRQFIGQRASLQSMDHVALGVIPKSRPSSGYWNPALDDTLELPEPEDHSHLLNFSGLANFCMDTKAIYAEFQTIPCDNVDLTSVPVGEEDKNRFANVLPHKHSRVTLKKTEDKKSEYINANYVDGYMGEKRVYIATQSPLVNTVDDFWRMIWEQQTRTILMLNPVTQQGKPKQSTCYWPDNLETDCRREFEDYVVTLKRRDVQHDYVDCTLELMDIERNLKREIHHFWFTCWSDTGPPEPLTFVKFVLDTRPHYENSGSPVVLHCGPGTGRTGVFIAVDVCMRMFEDRRRVDILNCVHKVRAERAGAVQTKEQYNLVYQALNEYAVILSSPSISTRSSVITLHAML